MKAIFLSAAVPAPERDPKRHQSGDTVRIRDAVDAIAGVVLPRGLLVWAEDPALAPFVRRVARATGWTERLKTYKSAWLREPEPPNAGSHPDLVWTPAGRDAGDSMDVMRSAMFGAHPWAATVFIGGMDGAEQEHALIASRFPDVPRFAVASTGGAARDLWERAPHPDEALQERLRTDLLYDLLFEDLLVPLLS